MVHGCIWQCTGARHENEHGHTLAGAAPGPRTAGTRPPAAPSRGTDPPPGAQHTGRGGESSAQTPVDKIATVHCTLGAMHAQTHGFLHCTSPALLLSSHARILDLTSFRAHSLYSAKCFCTLHYSQHRQCSAHCTLHTTLKTLNTLYPVRHCQYTIVSIFYTLNTQYSQHSILCILYTLHTV